MTTQLFIRPARDTDGKPLRVRKHDNPMQHLADEGEWVTSHKYWRRRLTDGSVEEVKPLKIVNTKGSKETDK